MARRSRSERRRQVARRRALAVASVLVLAAGTALAVGISGRESSAPQTSAAAGERPARAEQQHAAQRQTRRGNLERRAAAAVARFTRLGLPVYCGGHRGRPIALTFDDGPGSKTERVVLPLLRRAKARATFFVVGQSISGYPRALRRERMLAAIGNHTWSHALLTALSAGGVAGQIGNTQRAIERAGGGKPTLFRPPYGAHNGTVDATVRSLGLLSILWSVDSYDSRGFSRKAVVHTVLKLAQPGAIILMHENLAATVQGLPKILRVLEHRRFRLVTVPELLALDPPSVGQLRRGLQGCYARGASSYVR